MSTAKTRRAGAIITSIAAVGLIIGGTWGVGAALAATRDAPAPAPTSTFEPSRFVDDEPIEPTPTPTAEPVPVELPVTEAPVEPAPAPVEPAPAPPAPVVEPAPAPAPPPPPAPVRCPAGSVSTESDGYNDTACTWEVCFTVTVPDPAHPECDAVFRP